MLVKQSWPSSKQSEIAKANNPRPPKISGRTLPLSAPTLAEDQPPLTLSRTVATIQRRDETSNQPVREWVRLQRKLSVGAAGEVDEREAGRSVNIRAYTVEPQVVMRQLTNPTWSDPDVRKIQNELQRLGLYRLAIDGNLGDQTDSALVEAFGGDSWRTMKATDVLVKLKVAKPSPGKAGEHDLRFGEMFKDGILDMTLGLGFDEGKEKNADKQKNQRTARDNFHAALSALSFKEDKVLAIQLYKQVGRLIDPGAFGEFYVKQDVLTYKPPAGDARKIHAIVRFAYSLDGSQGKEVADVYKAGLEESDIAYYSGHGRYGSGPDFDRNYKFRLLKADGTEEQTIDYYDTLEAVLKIEGAKAKPRRSAWQQFLWRFDNKLIEVNASNAGNVVLNKKNLHPGDFGSNLMYWNVNRISGGSPAITGKDGELAKANATNSERKYRVVVFDGCRSVDYSTSLRATPGYDEKQADMFGSSKSLEWGDEGPTLAIFLESIISMQSAEQIAKNMDAKQSVGPNAYHAYGVDDNPIHK